MTDNLKGATETEKCFFQFLRICWNIDLLRYQKDGLDRNVQSVGHQQMLSPISSDTCKQNSCYNNSCINRLKQNIMEDHLFLYCAFENLTFVCYFCCFYCHYTWLAAHIGQLSLKNWLFTVMFRFKHVFLFLFGRKQTRIELNQTLAKIKLNKNCDEETQSNSLSIYWSSNSSEGLWWADSKRHITTVSIFY